MRLVVATLVLAVGVLGVGVGEAWAHAELSATEPVAGAVADNSPDQVVLSFTEDVSVEGEGVRVLDATAGAMTAARRRPAVEPSPSRCAGFYPTADTWWRGGWCLLMVTRSTALSSSRSGSARWSIPRWSTGRSGPVVTGETR